ncbi:MAG: chemotaxis protein CheA [Gammaproteobacteria bacterium]|nr:chemotaxis protein CheA [Gammaproteobacteria bacterium]
MAVDLRRFHPTFFEESLEAVALMEQELLDVERALQRNAAAVVDAECLNRIFRAAHSIKGGSGTFGFQQVADFAHAMESLLDDARSGRRVLDFQSINLLLRSVDCLRTLLQAARAETPETPAGVDALRAELERAQALPDKPRAASTPVAADASSWVIRFYPHPGLFHTGNDPLRLLRAIADLGQSRTRTDLSRLPNWADLDPETCYLGWELVLQTPVPRAALDEVFAWVIGDCELELKPVLAASSVATLTKMDDMNMSSIRVATAKVDALVDMVGELVITQTMLSQVLEGFTLDALPQLRAGIAQLERHSRDLQDGVLGIRMLPIGFVFSRLPRLTRDISTSLGKQIELSMSGERTELDKTIIERISDPLIHLVRNSIDHGIESPDDRVRAGKSPVGTIQLDAYHKAGSVVVEIEDDGRGLDRTRILQKARQRGLVSADVQLEPAQIDELIFTPGFSTAEVINDVSGRGVGLDVVRNNIRSLGGGVEVSSVSGQGARFTIRLPLTLAIVDGMSLQVGSEVYILPLAWIAESLRIHPRQVTQPAGGPEILCVRDEYLPLLRLGRMFNVPPRTDNLGEGIVVIIEADGKRAGLFVDELLGQQQVVLKSLDKHCQRLEGISAATILGDGTVALILDAGSLVRRAHGAVNVVAASGPTVGRVSGASATLH